MIENKNKLTAAHPLLSRIMRHAGRRDPFRVIECLRSQERQLSLFDSGASKTMRSLHLRQPDGFSHAVDVVPLVNGKAIDTSSEGFGLAQAGQFAWFLRAVYESGRMICGRWRISTGEEWKLRFGINWDGDQELLSDQSFDDWFHIEIRRIN